MLEDLYPYNTYIEKITDTIDLIPNILPIPTATLEEHFKKVLVNH